MEVRELICIRCPLGCPLTVSIEGDQVGVTGNSCGRGEEYGKKRGFKPYQSGDILGPRPGR